VQRPNPLMKNQDLWQDYKVLNFEHEAIQDIKPQEIIVETKEPPCLAYCMPAEKTPYGEMKFGKPFKMEIKLIAKTDLSIQLKTSVDMEPQSIIYIPYQKRWWKVESKVEGTIVCTPSSIQPNFVN